MMATRTVASKLSDQELSELLALIGDSDSVELKRTLQLSDRSRAGARLGVGPLDGKVGSRWHARCERRGSSRPCRRHRPLALG
jgi:hypothetical protein